MKDKKTFFAAVAVVTLFLAIIIFQQTRIYNILLEQKRAYAEHSLSVMLFIRDDMHHIAMEYEQDRLNETELQMHNERMDSYILSINNHEPKEFVENLNFLRELATYDEDSFDDTAYNQYLKIIGFFDYTNEKVEITGSDDILIDYYEAFSDEEFTSRLSSLIEGLKQS
jgi:hypothetical protein